MNLDYKNIIVAVDGSEASEKAFIKAVSIAKRNDAKIILTHVIDSRTFATAGAYDRSLAEEANVYGEELLERFEKKAHAVDFKNLIKSLEYGSPKGKITKEVSKKYDADLIICGATGLNAVERFLIGSVSGSITRNAECDVLVVR